MKVVYLKLTADVSLVHQRERKVKFLTKVTIRLDNAAVLATATVPGRLSQEQALAEFKKNPAKFLSHEPFNDGEMAAIAFGAIKPCQVFSVGELSPAVAA